MQRVFVLALGIKLPYKVSHGKALQIKYSPDEIFAKIAHEGIKFIDLQFTGLTGRFHHTTISAVTFTPEQMRDGLPKLDGSSIVGFTSIDDSDLVLLPDPNTFAIIPWMTENKTARLLCDVYWGGREEVDYLVTRGELHKKQKDMSSLRDLIIVLGVLK